VKSITIKEFSKARHPRENSRFILGKELFRLIVELSPRELLMNKTNPNV